MNKRNFRTKPRSFIDLWSFRPSCRLLGFVCEYHSLTWRGAWTCMCDMLNCDGFPRREFLDRFSSKQHRMLWCRKLSRLLGCFKVEQIPALSMTPKALGVGRNLTTPAEVTSVVLTSTTTSSSVYGLHILSIPILVESGWFWCPAERVESVFGWQKVVWRDACFGKLSISTLNSSLSHESTPSKSTVRYLRSSHDAVAASEEAKRVEDPLVVASTDRARRKGNLPPSCFFIPHSILFVDHNTDLLALAISITSGLCSTVCWALWRCCQHWLSSKVARWRLLTPNATRMIRRTEKVRPSAPSNMMHADDDEQYAPSFGCRRLRSSSLPLRDLPSR